MKGIRKLFQATDMTVGEPWKQIIRFTVPMLIGNIAQQLYNTAVSYTHLDVYKRQIISE